jgi:1,6-anhydro-N-acetylmuramate kinase
MGFYLSLMSGTSMDAIDAALVDFDVSPLRIIAASATAFAPRRHAPGAALYVCGGGAHNAALVETLAQLVAPNRVATTAALGLRMVCTAPPPA